MTDMNGQDIQDARRKLPDGWRWVRLGELCEIIAGQSPPSETYRSSAEGLPFFQGKADFGKRHPVAHTWCVAPRKIALPGDILISVRAPVGPTNIADIRCCVGRGLAAIRCPDGVCRDFVLWVLRISERALASLGSGSTFSAIDRNQLGSFHIPLAPFPEQLRIAAILNEQMAAVERARAAAEAGLEASKALHGAYRRAAFRSAAVRMWPKKPFGELVENFDGKRVPVKLDDRRDKKGPYPYYGASGIIDYVDEYLYEGEYLLIGEDGANLILRSSPIAFRASGKFWVNNHAHVVQPKIGYSLDYLLHFFAVTDLKPYVTGAAQPKLTQEDMNSIPVPVSSFAEQERIAAKLNDQMATVESIRVPIEDELSAINAFPTALLRRAFSGEI